MKNIFNSVLFLTCIILSSCNDSDRDKQDDNIELEEVSEIEVYTTIITPKTKTISEKEQKFEKHEILDSTIHQILVSAEIDKEFRIAYSHTPYVIEGLFNNDEIIDTAFIVLNISNNKEGLIIKYGSGNPYDYTILGAGERVLGQTFDDFIWVGKFKRLPKGTKAASNIDKNGEIMTEEVPDSLKTELPNDGIFIHASESCGGGIIYFDNNSYQWIQQE